jgi:hypothetical protein
MILEVNLDPKLSTMIVRGPNTRIAWVLTTKGWEPILAWLERLRSELETINA